ncbi:MAG: hypothetical protein ACW99U_21760 [Candidatus Thorarchaeota archaeon]|jgi:hypothetical protein
MQDRNQDIENALAYAFEHGFTRIGEALSAYCDGHGADYLLDTIQMQLQFRDADITDCERVEFNTMNDLNRLGQ